MCANYVSNQEIREQAGLISKERQETPTGTKDSSNTVFYTLNTPLIDKDRSDAVDVEDVIVYIDGVSVGTPASIVADTGKITVKTAPASGSAIALDYNWDKLEESVITLYANEGHSFVLSKIYEVYSLPLSTVPDIVVLIEKRYSAGLLLDKEYSAGGDESGDTRGKRWIEWAEKKLKEIVNGELELLDDDGVVLSQKSSGAKISGWPDNTTKDADDDEGGGDNLIRMSDEF